MPDHQMGNYKQGLVSVIIPTLVRPNLGKLRSMVQKRYLLKDCLSDCRKNITCAIEIIVVCNSADCRELVDYVIGSQEVDKYCINSVNAGVPRSWNMGAELAQGEYLCFVNDDVFVGPGAIEAMKESLENDASVGEVGPAGGRWHRQESGARVGLKIIEEADEISGWLFMTKRTVFDQVGGFDLSYTPAFCEEIDFSFAVRNAGYRCLVLPGLNATHHHLAGASSTKYPLKALDIEIDREELTARNRRYFEKKWSNFWEKQND